MPRATTGDFSCPLPQDAVAIAPAVAVGPPNSDCSPADEPEKKRLDGSTTLKRIVEMLSAERDIEPITIQQYARSAACFSRYVGRPGPDGATCADLGEDAVNDWLRSLSHGRKKSPATVLGRKRGLTAVWNHAADIGAARPYNPTRLRKINVPKKPPVAWSVNVVRAMLAACENVSGTLTCGLAAPLFLRAYVLLGFETGLRPSDLRRLRFRDICFERRTISIVQHKTRNAHVAALSDRTIAALRAILEPSRDVVFPLTKAGIRYWSEKLLREVGVAGSVSVSSGQGLGMLRKSHATEIARRDGLEVAARSLGHVSGSTVARQHYVEPSAVSSLISPPEW